MVVVAEEPGIGLGAALAAWTAWTGRGFGSAPPIATASFGKHDFRSGRWIRRGEPCSPAR